MERVKGVRIGAIDARMKDTWSSRALEAGVENCCDVDSGSRNGFKESLFSTTVIKNRNL